MSFFCDSSIWNVLHKIWMKKWISKTEKTGKKQSNSKKFPQLIPLTAKLGYGKVFLLRKVSNMFVPEAGIKSFYTWFFSGDLMARVTFEKKCTHSYRLVWDRNSQGFSVELSRFCFSYFVLFNRLHLLPFWLTGWRLRLFACCNLLV